MNNAERLYLMEGSEAIWYVVNLVPTVIIGMVLVSILDPLLSPYEQELSEGKEVARLIFAALIVVLIGFSARSYLWRPIRKLYRICANKDLFFDHVLHIGKSALPFAPLFALPLTLLCFDLSGWMMAIQIGIIIGLDKLAEHLRQPKLAFFVDDLTRRLSAPAAPA